MKSSLLVENDFCPCSESCEISRNYDVQADGTWSNFYALVVEE